MKFDARIVTEFRIEIEAAGPDEAKAIARGWVAPLASGGKTPQQLYKMAVPDSIGHTAELKDVTARSA